MDNVFRGMDVAAISLYEVMRAMGMEQKEENCRNKLQPCSAVSLRAVADDASSAERMSYNVVVCFVIRLAS